MKEPELAGKTGAAMGWKQIPAWLHVAMICQIWEWLERHKDGVSYAAFEELKEILDRQEESESLKEADGGDLG